MSGSGVAVGLCILNLLSIASATSTTLTYTTTNDNTHRGTCHTAARCVGNLNDGVTGSSGWTASNDWLPSGITAANMATKAWVIMDLGSSNTQCVGKIGVYQINQQADNRRNVATFDLLASDSTGASSFTTTLLSNAALAAAGTTAIERQVNVPSCVVHRYIKFVAKTVTTNCTRCLYIYVA